MLRKMMGMFSVTYSNTVAFTLVIFYHYTFILLTFQKATEVLIHGTTNYLNLLPKMPRYCCPVEIYYFNFYKDITKI